MIYEPFSIYIQIIKMEEAHHKSFLIKADPSNSSWPKVKKNYILSGAK